MHKYNVGLLGAGYIAEWHLKALAKSKLAKVTAIADLDRGRANDLAQQYGAAAVYDSLGAMLANPAIDVVHILTPPNHHLAAAQEVLAAGKACFLEKPAVTSTAECDALAATAKSAIGVNHNFLFQSAYQELRAAVQGGQLGPIESLVIAWRKPMPQINLGPFDSWMLAQPEHLLMEVGPHSASILVDLLGEPPEVFASRGSAKAIPGGRFAYRQWSATAQYERAVAQLLFSFGPGVSEHYLHVRGTHGRAEVDFESNIFTLDRPTRFGPDYDRFKRGREVGKKVRRQAQANLLRYMGSKFGVAKHGNAYGASIAESIETFYESLATTPEPRQTLAAARQAIHVCERIADATKHATANREVTSEVSSPITVHSQPITASVISSDAAEPYLVFGGTGFIGRRLVAQLLAGGHKVRLVARRPANVDDAFRQAGVEIIRGCLTKPHELRGALEGVAGVFHLARAQVKRWAEYQRLDIEPSRQLAELCLEAGVPRLVYTGTIDSYYAGKHAGEIAESTGLDRRIERRNLYARAKQVIEQDLLQLHAERQLPLVIVRPGIVIGSGGSPFHWGIGMWNSDSAVQVWGDGRNPLPLVLAEDVADGLIRAMTTPGIEGESFNLVADTSLTAREYLDALQERLGVSIDVIPTPIWKFYATDMAKWVVKTVVRHPERRLPSYRDWESRTQQGRFDCTKAKEVLGWRPTEDAQALIEKGIYAPAAEVFA